MVIWEGDIAYIVWCPSHNPDKQRERQNYASNCLMHIGGEVCTILLDGIFSNQKSSII